MRSCAVRVGVRHQLDRNNESVSYLHLPLGKKGVIPEHDLLRERGTRIPCKELGKAFIGRPHHMHKEGALLHGGRRIDVTLEAPSETNNE